MPGTGEIVAGCLADSPPGPSAFAGRALRPGRRTALVAADGSRHGKFRKHTPAANPPPEEEGVEEASRTVAFSWREAGTALPPTAPPDGFRTTLLTVAIPSTLGGTAAELFAGDRFSHELRFPLRGARSDEGLPTLALRSGGGLA